MRRRRSPLAHSPCRRASLLALSLGLAACNRSQAFPEPGGDLDGDTAAAVVAGAELTLGREVVVR
jgi:hypothetical protein